MPTTPKQQPKPISSLELPVMYPPEPSQNATSSDPSQNSQAKHPKRRNPRKPKASRDKSDLENPETEVSQARRVSDPENPKAEASQEKPKVRRPKADKKFVYVNPHFTSEAEPAEVPKPKSTLNPHSKPFVPRSNLGRNPNPEANPNANRSHSDRSNGSEVKEASTRSFRHSNPHDPTSRFARNRDRPSRASHSNHEQTNISIDVKDMTLLGAQIAERLQANTYECLVCIETIKRKTDIWTCDTCYGLFHSDCVSAWYLSSVASTSESSKLGNKLQWRCPKCQAQKEAEPQPSCFCGKERRVEFNPYLLPHSCGNSCSKFRSATCPHPCTLACHPGPCPPCSAMAPPLQCHCKRQTFNVRCAEKATGKSCGETCGRPLECGRHLCEEPCHPGECKKCDVKEKTVCYCRKHNKEKMCHELRPDSGTGGAFSCESACQKKLECGNHECALTCHTGKCPPCPTSTLTIKSCGCGRNSITKLLRAQNKGDVRKSCLDEIPTCGKVCDKYMPCGHQCQSNCHNGECPPCMKTIKVICRCGSESTTKVCSTAFNSSSASGSVSSAGAFICNRKCEVLRSCGRHRCHGKCCPGSKEKELSSIHICPLKCGKKMNCGVHKCELPCHKGRCPNCQMATNTSRSCHCGRSIRRPPIPCGDEQPPFCSHPCSRVHPCNHTVMHSCHSNKDCPPCVILIDSMCSGGHEVRNKVPCYLSTSGNITCGRSCGLILPCGKHSCKRTCHAAPCLDLNARNQSTSSNASRLRQQPEAPQAEEGDIVGCGQACGRYLNCSHLCKAPCHPTTDCPQNICKINVIVRCACGFQTIGEECWKAREAEQKGKALVLCDDSCTVNTRNRKLAEALGIVDNSTNQIKAPAFYRILKEKDASGQTVQTLTAVYGQALPVYSDHLISFAVVNPSFVEKIENTLRTFLSDPKSGNTFNFPPMNKANRRIVRELANVFNLDAVSLDMEPNRNVLVYKKHDSKIPCVTVAQTIKNSNANSLQSFAPAKRGSMSSDNGSWTGGVSQSSNSAGYNPQNATSVIARIISAHSKATSTSLSPHDEVPALTNYSEAEESQEKKEKDEEEEEKVEPNGKLEAGEAVDSSPEEDHISSYPTGFPYAIDVKIGRLQSDEHCSVSTETNYLSEARGAFVMRWRGNRVVVFFPDEESMEVALESLQQHVSTANPNLFHGYSFTPDVLSQTLDYIERKRDADKSNGFITQTKKAKTKPVVEKESKEEKVSNPFEALRTEDS